MYTFKSDLDINSLVDGRTILYLSKKISFSREHLSKVLRGLESCNYKRANDIVKACQPDKKVEDYFIKVKKEG